jgi:hypothetical protein
MPLVRFLAVPLLAAAALVGCGEDDDSTSEEESAPVETATRSPRESVFVESPLVGSWVGIHECELIVQALREAGFDETVVLENVVGNGLVPDANSPQDIADPANPCAGAVPREHGHFFTTAGEFGSTDYNDEEVDFGTYEIVDDDTVSINGTEFGYAIEEDTLTLEAIVPAGCLTFECQWSIMVAMAGQPLQRQP